ncbi:MAG: hypothetical protein ACJAVI_004268 [Candidatus Azotimanducaceae bacterium]|jgi:hypothetical protein
MNRILAKALIFVPFLLVICSTGGGETRHYCKYRRASN